MIPSVHGSRPVPPLTGVRFVSLYLAVLIVGAILLTAIQGWAS